MLARRPSRLSTFQYTGGARYFFTMCCKNRQRHFLRAGVVSAVTLELLHTSSRRQFAVLAYTFMPDHFHGLIQGMTEDADFCGLVRVLRRRTTIAAKFTCPDGLWQDGYYERVLRDDDDPQTVIDYILNNPIRAGLVDRAADYPHSWSCTLEEDSRP